MSSTSDPATNPPETKATCALNSQIPDKYWEEASEACAGDANCEHEGKRFCVMHYPVQNKTEAFRDALRKKIAAEDFNFCGVYFPEEVKFSSEFLTSTDFSFAIFGSDADFSSAKFGQQATFMSATFIGSADFMGAEFSDVADFTAAAFRSDAYFGYAFSFTTGIRAVAFNSNANFSYAEFSGKANFGSAKFIGNADFLDATFSGLTLFTATEFLKEINFRNAQFKDYVKFKDCKFGEGAALTFDSLRIEKPERLSFHSVKLRPHWFINTDPRKFEFIDVDWGNIAKELKSELANTKTTTSPHHLLSIAYRDLAMNAEERHRYDEAMNFRDASMETSFLSSQKKWLEDWCKQRHGKWSFETSSWWWNITLTNVVSLNWWYRTLSRYGESPTRAAIVLLLLLVLSCVPYWFTGFAPSKEDPRKNAPVRVALSPNQSKIEQAFATFVYSLETASLQKPEPRPVTTVARFFVGLETILAPLQAALLALAIRRRYLR